MDAPETWPAPPPQPDLVVVYDIYLSLAEVAGKSFLDDQRWLYDNWAEASSRIASCLHGMPAGATLMLSAGRMSRADYAALQPDDDPLPAPADYQDAVAGWVRACMGPAAAADVTERGDRFLEESLELLQAAGYTRDRVAALTAYVYGRPVGQPAQELGGTVLTLAALAHAMGLRMQYAGDVELGRVCAHLEAIRAKWQAKPRGSALPQVVPSGTCRCGKFTMPDEAMSVTARGHSLHARHACKWGLAATSDQAADEFAAGLAHVQAVTLAASQPTTIEGQAESAGELVLDYGASLEVGRVDAQACPVTKQLCEAAPGYCAKGCMKLACEVRPE